MYTDGLIEGRATPGSDERFGIDRLTTLTGELRSQGLTGEALLDALIVHVQRCNGGPADDDVALCLVSIPEAADRGA